MRNVLLAPSLTSGHRYLASLVGDSGLERHVVPLPSWAIAVGQVVPGRARVRRPLLVIAGIHGVIGPGKLENVTTGQNRIEYRECHCRDCIGQPAAAGAVQARQRRGKPLGIGVLNGYAAAALPRSCRACCSMKGKML